jgi:LPS-assembly lipoprotein
MKRRTFLVQLAALSLTGCGFQLRGSQAIPYQNIYLDANKKDSDISYEGGLATVRKESIGPPLTQALLDQGVTIAASPKEADATLRVSRERLSRTILSLSGGGRVREYRLNYSVTYNLIGKDGKEIFPDSTIQSTRDFTYDDNLYLAKSAEERFLFRDQIDAAVRQIMRRLATPR